MELKLDDKQHNIFYTVLLKQALIITCSRVGGL